MLHPYSEFAGDWSGATITFPGHPAAKARFLSSLEGRSPWAIASGVVAITCLLASGLFARMGLRTIKRVGPARG